MMIVRNQDKDYIAFLENVQGISVCEELDERASVVFEYANKIKTMGRYRSYDIAREVANAIRRRIWKIMIIVALTCRHKIFGLAERR